MTVAVEQQSAVSAAQAVAFPAARRRELPVVVVGNGPVGMRFAAEYLSRDDARPVVIYGDEVHQAYNRVRLSSWLAGDVSEEELAEPLKRPFGSCVSERFGYRIESIDRAAKAVRDSSGREQPYHRLVLATGSRAFVPDIPGIHHEGTYTLRNRDDATRLFARRVRSRHCVVIGGGLLGLETARGMQPNNTRVTIVDHSDRLMSRQLDIESSSLLEKQVKSLGFNIMLGDGVARICGDSRVTGVRLHSGIVIDCDTAIIAAGIRPAIDLARDAGLAYGRGIRVNDKLLTTDPDIYAIGECAEHDGNVYGLVAPGFEQAASLAAHLAGESGSYKGSLAAARLKVVGTSVFSIGPVGDTANPLEGRKHVYRNPGDGVYRKLVVRRHRLVGAIGIGDWSETVRLQSVMARDERIMPWQLLRFRRTGSLWQDSAAEVSGWPQGAIVCQCNNVTRGRLGEAMALGAHTPDALGRATGAGTTCGSCKPLLAQLVGSPVTTTRARFSTPLLVIACVALAGIALLVGSEAIPYAQSVLDTGFAGIDLGASLDILWRDGFIKQVSGFTTLFICVLASLITLRKRTPWIDRLGSYLGWRLVHTLIGTATIASLVVHTGMRLGHGLNFWLMTCFLALLAVGAVASLGVAMEHKLGQSAARAVRRQSVLLHIFLLWPLPVLLAFHILKGYWY